MEEHRGIARVSIANVPTGENSLLVADNLMGLLLAGGVTPRDAAWSCDVLPLFVSAAAVETATYQERGSEQEDVVDKLEAVFTDPAGGPLPPPRASRRGPRQR